MLRLPPPSFVLRQILIYCVLGSFAAAEQTNKSDDVRRGWTPSPNQRGTLDILWTCLFTLSLCCWSVLCLNVPSPRDSTFQVLVRRIWLTALGVLGPEFIFLLALGQCLSAYRSVNAFHAAGFRDWTLRHAFYADMGALVIRTRDAVPDADPMPIDAQQLLWLVQRGYLDYPRLSIRHIRDKNKTDAFLRLLTLLQALWFVTNVVLRAAQGLAITTLELTTSAFVFCALATSICWVKKPADVMTPELIECNFSMAEILASAGRSLENEYRRTPLEFISRKEWDFSKLWTHSVNILRHMKINFAPSAKPVNRFENTIFLDVSASKISHGIAMLVSYSYLGIFLVGCSYNFPTRLEGTLWKVASVAELSVCIVAVPMSTYATKIHPAFREWRMRKTRTFDVEAATDVTTSSDSSGLTSSPDVQHFSKATKNIADSLRNKSPEKDPELYIPLKALIPAYIFQFCYCIARAYIWVSDFAELRSLPASAYQTVSWTWIVPHL